MGFLLITVVVISYLNVLSTIVFLLFVSLIFFCFVLLSNIFFSQDVFQVVFFHFLLSFLPIENKLKILIKIKIGCVFVLCSRCTSQKVNVGVENVFLKFFTKANNLILFLICSCHGRRFFPFKC